MLDSAPGHVRLLLAVRARQQWSQARLASELCVSVRTVRRWERGETDPPVLVMRVLRLLLEDDDAA